MNELVSIIVPIYGVENYLDECIESIVNQSYKLLEIILVDDGTKDSSGEIADQWEKKDSRIKVIHKKNGGISSARNAGIDIAKGKYIIFVDSDDYLDKFFVEKLYATQQEYDADIAICYEHSFEDGCTSSVEEALDIDEILVENYSEFMNHFNEVFRGRLTWAWNKIYRRDVIGDVRFEEGRALEDVLFITDLSFSVNRVVWIPERLYYYRQRNSSIMHSKFEKVTLDYLYALRYEFDKLSVLGTEFNSKHGMRLLGIVHHLYKESLKNKSFKVINDSRHTYDYIFDGIEWETCQFLKRIKYNIIGRMIKNKNISC